MGKLTIVATDDVPDEPLNALVAAIGSNNCRLPSSKRMLLSMEPPSYVELVGNLVTWRTVLVASATAFFGKIAARLADDVYDASAVIAGELFKPVRRVAQAIAESLQKTPERSFLQVTISQGHGNAEASIAFWKESDSEIAFKLACFYAASEQIIGRLSDLIEEYNGRVTPPVVAVSDKGDVTVRCYAGMENDEIEFTIPLHDL